MRVPPVQSRRRPIGIRGWLIAAAIVLIVLLLSARGLARFYTDYLWFKEVHFASTWRRLIEAKAFPALIFSVLFLVLLFVDLVIADRLAPIARTTGPEDEIIERYRSVVEPYAGRIRFAVAAFFAIVMGSGVSSEWRDWILFSHATKFGVKDPQFHRDIGFYVFKLPFLEFIAGWTFAALLVILIVTLVFHYLNGGIRLQTPFQRVTPQVKVHISVILALMALTKTVQYYLSRFGLTLSHRGVVDGATYTDVHAQLPALNLLMFISVAAAILFILNIFRRGWVFPIIAVGLWGFISIVVGTIYPAIIQRFVVQPNEFAREQTYIKRNNEATRSAFQLDTIKAQPFDYSADLTSKQVNEPDNQQTLSNARLWDPAPLAQVLASTEEFQPFYSFSDVDVDRYDVKGEPTMTLSGVRELNPALLPSNTWTNRHLVYTHGYGIDSAAANAHNQDQPSYLLSDIPPQGTLPMKQPDVYFGEGFSGYAVVDSKVAEQEANGETSTASTQYKGSGGVKVGGLTRRLAYALRFGDFNLVYSGQITSQSRILYLRDIQERVQTAAPFLQWDSDPYAVNLHGKIVWVLDGYTSTNQYPYSQSIDPTVPNGSGLNTNLNYVRNSVKATVDAYNGTIHFYVVDPKDPIIRAYEKAFPGLFESADKMPSGLPAHLRYPEDIFDAQTQQYALYHMTDALQFFQKAALWDVAPSPDAATGTSTQATNNQVGGNNGGRNSTLSGSGTPVDPLYLTMQLPPEPNQPSQGQQFVLERPFVPISKDNQLSSFLVAGNDGKNYGKLTLYEVPDQSLAPSPARAASLIEADPNISKIFSLLDQHGSTVVRGAAQLVPIDNSIFYVRPIYVEGTGSQPLPRWNFVAVTYGEHAVLDTSVTDAVSNLLANTIPDAETSVLNGAGTSTTTPITTPTTSTTTPTSTPITAPPKGTTVASLLAQADQLTAAANQALANQDLAGYAADIKRQQALIADARQLETTGSAPPTSSSTTSTTTGTTTTAPKGSSGSTSTSVAHA